MQSRALLFLDCAVPTHVARCLLRVTWPNPNISYVGRNLDSSGACLFRCVGSLHLTAWHMWWDLSVHRAPFSWQAAHGVCCSEIAEAEAAVSVSEKEWLVMHMHVQLKLDELRAPQTLGSL
jgi:hypothetical protein